MIDKSIRNKIRFYSILRYSAFFILIVIVATFSVKIFIETFFNTVGFDLLSEENINLAAINTFRFLLVFLLTLSVATIINTFLFIRLPLDRIIKRQERLMNGDFSYSESKKSIKSEYDIIEDGLNSVAKELSKVATLRDDFTSNISHEIKTPIAKIQNYAQLLKLGSLDREKEEEYLDGIIASANRLSEFTTSVVKLTKLENREIFSLDNNVDLSALLSECIVPFIDKIGEKSIALELDIEENITLKSDSELLSLAISNIISNAVKFTPSNGKVSIMLFKEEGKIKLSILDSGCGISRDDIRHIFDKYYRGQNEDKAEGTGLGLAMVKRIADILNFKIEVESIINKGTKFTLTF